MTEITLYHTNDVHSYFEEYLRLCPYLRQADLSHSLILDSGDFCDFRDVMVSATMGKGAQCLLESVHTTAMAAGNNEIFGGYENLRAMLENQPPILSCNLFPLDDDHPLPNLKPAIMVEKAGIRFLLIGVSPYFGSRPVDQTFFKMSGVKTVEPVSCIKPILQQYTGQYDCAVLLSHLGYQNDCRIASEIDVDLICGGHSHTLINSPELINHTYIIQSGCHGQQMTSALLRFDSCGKLRDCSAEILSPTNNPDKLAEAVYQKQCQIAHDIYNQEITTWPSALSYDALKPCGSTTFLCEALTDRYGGDFAMINNGVIEKAIGPLISKETLLQACSSPLNPTRLKWSGLQIIEAYLASLDHDFASQNGFGAGFRGKILGTLSFSHQITINPQRKTIFLNNQPLNPQANYEVITHDYLQRGTGYSMLATDAELCQFYPEYLRDDLQWACQRKDLLSIALK